MTERGDYWMTVDKGRKVYRLLGIFRSSGTMIRPDGLRRGRSLVLDIFPYTPEK